MGAVHYVSSRHREQVQWWIASLWNWVSTRGETISQQSVSNSVWGRGGSTSVLPPRPKGWKSLLLVHHRSWARLWVQQWDKWSSLPQQPFPLFLWVLLCRPLRMRRSLPREYPGTPTRLHRVPPSWRIFVPRRTHTAHARVWWAWSTLKDGVVGSRRWWSRGTSSAGYQGRRRRRRWRG